MAEEKGEVNTSRPFQLRPSILGSGSGLSSSNSSLENTSSKAFALRPSALSNAAEKLTTKPEGRKRSLDSEDTEDRDDSKKRKKEEEVVEKEATSEDETVEGIPQPTGIGTFGFAKDSGDKNNGANKKDESPAKVNYFQQGVENGQKPLGFVFGAKNCENNNGGGFKSLIETEATESKVGAGGENITNASLKESADEYTKTHTKTQHYEEVEQLTGEEGEKQILQISCKLHQFNNISKTWQEKGRGTLRLNDIAQSEGIFQSRIVFRSQGTNIVYLNTKLWPEMCCEQVREKNLRISALTPESQDLKLFLINASSKECQQVYSAITRRIAALKRNKEQQSSPDNSSKTNDSEEDSNQ